MSDIFTHLVERALGSAATIQPLLAPRFAAASDLAGSVEMPPSNSLDAASTPPAPVTRFTPPSATRSADNSMGPADTHVTVPENYPDRTVVHVQAATLPQFVQPQNASITPPTHTEAIGGHAAPTTVPAALPISPFTATRSELAATPPAQAITVSTPQGQLPLTTPQATPPLDSPIAKSVALPELTPYRVETRPAQQPASLPGLRVPTALQTLPSPSDNEATPPPPTIHVNIGRIEVRAVSPAPAATPATSRPTGVRSSAVMSLEEYLKRAGGSQ